MKAVQAAIDACPRGYGRHTRGCRIRLPAGTIRGRWKIGGPGHEQLQVGVCLMGQGPGWGSTYPDGKPGAAGTTLVYEGPPGGTLLDFAGGDFVCLRDLSIAMHGAGVGIRLSASRTPIQNPMIERVSIAGDRNQPGGTALLISDHAKNGQVDALLAHELKIDYVDVGIEVDSHQAVTNRIGPGTKISAQQSAVRINAGSLSLDGVLAQCRTARCCTYDLRQGHGYFRVRDGYHEIGMPPARDAKLLCMNSRSLPGVGSGHMASINESYINVLCDASEAPCSVDLVDARSNVTVVFRDNWITSAGGAGERKNRFARVLFSGGLLGEPRLVWSGNGVHPDMGGLRAQISAGTRIEAIAADGKTLWNDLDLDGRWDAGEPRMSGE